MRRLLINLLIVFVLLSAPVTLFTVGWGYMQVYDQFGLVPFLIACACGFTSFLGIASLIDKEQDRRNPQQPYR